MAIYFIHRNGTFANASVVRKGQYRRIKDKEYRSTAPQACQQCIKSLKTRQCTAFTAFYS